MTLYPVRLDHRAPCSHPKSRLESVIVDNIRFYSCDKCGVLIGRLANAEL